MRDEDGVVHRVDVIGRDGLALPVERGDEVLEHIEFVTKCAHQLRRSQNGSGGCAVRRRDH
jgi:hypothetical protein